jgi:hypothetical protein
LCIVNLRVIWDLGIFKPTLAGLVIKIPELKSDLNQS